MHMDTATLKKATATLPRTGKAQKMMKKWKATDTVMKLRIHVPLLLIWSLWAMDYTTLQMV